MLCWNVYCGDFNGGQIELYNIFDHWRFYDDCVKAKKKYKDDRAGFEESVRGNLMYYFWSKCEWEIILSHWPSGEFYDLRASMPFQDIGETLREHGAGHEAVGRVKPELDVELRVFPKSNRFRERKIDVYEQVMNNWEPFINYLWENRKELRARK